MELNFDKNLLNGKGYHSASQISRVLTEGWVEQNMFCPVCGAKVLLHYKANNYQLLVTNKS